MAKKKRAAALFEVMVKQEQRRLPRRPGVFKTLYLWFKNRPRPERPAAVAAMAARDLAQEAVITAPFLSPPPPQPEYIPPPPPPPRIEPQVRETISSSLSSASSSKKLTGEFNFRISYGTMIIATFAVATVVITAYLAGRKTPSVPKTVLASTTTDQLRTQPPRANLTNIATPRRMQTPAPAPVDNNSEPADVAPPSPGSAHAANAPTRSKERLIGANYVVIQSYTEEKMANDMATLLKQNGIDCTVEKGLPLWLKYSVVGVNGFTRISSNPQLDAYLAKIRSINDLYIKSRTSFKAFDPKPFKWQNWTRKD